LAVAELLRPQYQDGSLGYRWTNWVTWSYYLAYHNPDDEMSFVAVDEMGNVVGVAVAFNDELPPGEDDELPPEGWEDVVPPEKQTGRYYVETVTVRGDMREQGIATMLMGAVESEAVIRGLWPIVIMVPPSPRPPRLCVSTVTVRVGIGPTSTRTNLHQTDVKTGPLNERYLTFAEVCKYKIPLWFYRPTV